MVSTNMASLMEMSLYSLLLVLFLVFFGIPSVEKYQSKETIVISSRKFTNGIEAPAVTFMALNNKTGYGWKSETNQTSSVTGRYTNTFLLDHCKEINQTDLEGCISNDSLELTDFLTTATFQMLETSFSELNISSWTADIDAAANGRHFTWNPQRSITPDWADVMFLSVHKLFRFYVWVHDVKFSSVSTNPLGTTSTFFEINGNSQPNLYQELILVKHKKLNLDHRPCEESEDYSFTRCVKENIAETVGCRMPWDKISRQDRVICTEQEQFRKTDLKATTLLIKEVDEVERMTGCLKPCSYKEYKFVNSQPKDMVVAAVPDDQLAILLWAVTQYTQFEEEVPSVNHLFSS